MPAQTKPTTPILRLLSQLLFDAVPDLGGMRRIRDACSEVSPVPLSLACHRSMIARWQWDDSL